MVTGTSLMETDYDLIATNDIHQNCIKRRVDLHRKDLTSPTGMYHCDIATVDVHDNETTQLTRKRVYVGLYANGGGLQ